MNPESPRYEIAERRRSERRVFQARLRLEVETEELEGITENVSNYGVLFFSQTPLRVKVEFEEDGELRTYSGTLVRTQRMSEDNTGFAVEFDRD